MTIAWVLLRPTVPETIVCSYLKLSNEDMSVGLTKPPIRVVDSKDAQPDSKATKKNVTTQGLK